MTQLVFSILLQALPFVILVAAGTILMRNWRARESHTVWLTGAVLVILGVATGIYAFVSSPFLIPVNFLW